MKGNKNKRTTADNNSQQLDKVEVHDENTTARTSKIDNSLQQTVSKLSKKIKGYKKLNNGEKQERISFISFIGKGVVNVLRVNKSLGMKIFLIFIVSLVSCVATVGFSSYNLSRSTLEDNIIGTSEETIKQVARNIDTSLSNYDDLTFQLMFDEKVISNITNYVSNEDAILQIDAFRVLNDLLSTFIFSNTQLKNIAIIPATKNAQPIVGGTVSGNTSMLPTTEEFQAEAWFQDVIAKNGTVVWIAPQADGIVEGGFNDTVALARVVNNTTKGNEFVLIMEFNTGNLFSAANEVEVINNSYLEIIDINNTYIKPQDVSLTGAEANFNLVENIKDPLIGSFRTKHKQTGDEFIIVYSQIAENNSWYLSGALPYDEIKKEIKPIFNFTTIMIVIATLLAIVIGIIMLRMVSRPLTQISTVMTKGAKGDLTVRAPFMNRQDEIGVLAKTFDDMMIQIEGLARQTTESAKSVLTTATDLSQASHKTAVAGKEISIATDEIAAGASALAEEAEKGSELTSNINKQMSHVNTSREQMNESAEQVDQASEQGVHYMTGLIERTGETEQMVNQMVDKVNALSESTKSIVKILDVLNNITKQTNILSLNATIEAARAGQAGKGFMVVADEIRQLASQSRESIDVVGRITETISKEIVDTVNVLKKAQPIFQEQIVSVKEANQIFISVRGQMDLLKHNISDVSVAFDELSHSQDTLSQSMNNVSAVAQQSSATSEEVASLSSEQLVISEQLVNLSSQLESVSENLKAQLSKFKIS